MSSLHRSSIRRRLLFLASVPALIAVASVTMALGLYDVHRLAGELESKGRVYGELFAEQVVSAVEFHDRETAREVFAAARRDPDITGIALYTEAGEQLYMTGRVPHGLTPTAVTSLRSDVVDDTLVVRAPVRALEGGRGTVVVSISTRPLHTRRESAAAIALAAALLAVSLALAFAVPMATGLSRRIRSLSTVAARVGNGDLDVAALHVGPADEIGVTANAFNSMIGTIRDLLEQQRLQAETERVRLETLVAERTGELEQAIAGLKAAQVQLVQGQKLEAIGQLAAGIAHEINTPAQFAGDNVTFLRGAFERLVAVLEPCRRVVEAGGGCAPELVAEARQAVQSAQIDRISRLIPPAFDDADEGLRRISTIVSAMRLFSHPSNGVKAPVDLAEVVQATATIASNEWKYVADLVTDFDAALPLVPCLRDELSQALLNCIVNAAHAIADVHRSDGGKGTISISTRRDGDWAELRIADTGSGIPESVRHRVFNPFFTTKEVGKGTGQGLAITYGVVVDRHGGALSFDSEVGVGTTFLIRLPLAEALASAA